MKINIVTFIANEFFPSARDPAKSSYRDQNYFHYITLVWGLSFDIKLVLGSMSDEGQFRSP
jgi:hypothetical protein